LSPSYGDFIRVKNSVFIFLNFILFIFLVALEFELGLSLARQAFLPLEPLRQPLYSFLYRKYSNHIYLLNFPLLPSLSH
jgi:hypothetical protein